MWRVLFAELIEVTAQIAAARQPAEPRCRNQLDSIRRRALRNTFAGRAPGSQGSSSQFVSSSDYPQRQGLWRYCLYSSPEAAQAPPHAETEPKNVLARIQHTLSTDFRKGATLALQRFNDAARQRRQQCKSTGPSGKDERARHKDARPTLRELGCQSLARCCVIHE